ncbi:MAG: hypothetical protein ACYC3A_09990 [Halothiobacillus sp.]
MPSQQNRPPTEIILLAISSTKTLNIEITNSLDTRTLDVHAKTNSRWNNRREPGIHIGNQRIQTGQTQ